MTVIISHFDRQLLRNKLIFALCTIYILFNSNEFHKFWMSFDFRSKVCQNWTKLAGNQAGRPGTSTYMAISLIQGQYDMSTVPSNRGLDVGLIKWTKRHWHGSKGPITQLGYAFYGAREEEEGPTQEG